jgi:hypothetical protein
VDPASIVLAGPLEPPPPDRGGDPGTGAAPEPTAVVTAQNDPGKIGAPADGQDPKPAAPVPGLDPGVIANRVISEAAVRVSVVVKPAAAAAVATTFSFPLVLMVAVLLFLLVQRYVDARDPKLRAAPRSNADAVVAFQDEDGL